MHKSLVRSAPGALPLHMVTAKGAKAFLATRAGLAAAGFAGRDGELMPVMAGAKVAAWVLGLGDGHDPFAAATFAEKLPDGVYRLGEVPRAFGGDTAMLAWLLGTYSFTRYKTAKNKAHPMVQTLFEMLDNKDYYGALIRNPDDAMFKQIKDEILFPAEQMVPFSVRNFQRQQQLSENQKPWYDFIASPSMVGITPVPMALARDEALQEELDRRFRRPALIKKLRKETLQQ